VEWWRASLLVPTCGLGSNGLLQMTSSTLLLLVAPGAERRRPCYSGEAQWWRAACTAKVQVASCEGDKLLSHAVSLHHRAPSCTKSLHHCCGAEPFRMESSGHASPTQLSSATGSMALSSLLTATVVLTALASVRADDYCSGYVTEKDCLCVCSQSCKPHC
jgi:hypothetical protein